ncbi:MAG: DNA cytosine methyltransferase [Caldilineaceae bacterium]|nr:DNA cytosine methyltransferase [Caldilineaceae bacterium]
MTLKQQKNLKFLDLFAGAGGLSEGFIRAGFIPVAHVEVNKAACFTLKTRTAYHWLKKQNQLQLYYDYLHGKIERTDLYNLVPRREISSVIDSEIGADTLPEIFKKIDGLLEGERLDLIIGGPPCQAYSVVGRSRDKNNMKGDKRNYLYIYYAEFLTRYKPKYFIFENVTGLLSAKDENGESYFDNMKKLFKDVGYETEYRVLSANNYGVLQKRKRIILIGCSEQKEDFFPEPEQWHPNVKVEEVLTDLPFIKAGEGSIFPSKLKKYSGQYLYDARIRNGNEWVTLHIARAHIERDLEIYRLVVKQWSEQNGRLHYYALPDHLKTHKNHTSFTDRFKVVAADLPVSHTIVAHIAKDGHYYIHPDIEQNRSLTPREAARLQTFPDDYFFESEKEERGWTRPFRQIGNAVPVLLAQKIAERLWEIW